MSTRQGRPEPSSIATASEGVTVNDFWAFMPAHNYFFVPTRDLWPASSVNARMSPVPLLGPDSKPLLGDKGEPVEMKPSAWLDKFKPAEQMTWAPGESLIISDRIVSEGGWIDRKGVNCINLYRPPTLPLGDPTQADPWLNHVKKVYPDDADHLICWLAHRVQRPQEKINHALVLGGEQGIGKDTLIEPAKRAVGPWNAIEISPEQLVGRFNGFAKSVILRINEAHDLGELNRYQFYEHLKVYTANPPDVLRVDEKNLREYGIINCCGVIITTNHKTDGMYLPADDRRHFVAWSSLKKENFDEAYWRELWNWYGRGGDGHVAAYLKQLDIRDFNPKAPPPKTAAFLEIVNANRAPEDAELADALDRLERRDVVTMSDVIRLARPDFSEWLKDRKNRRIIPHRFEACGYVPVRNPDAESGLWRIGGERQVIYGRTQLSLSEQIRAARELVR